MTSLTPLPRSMATVMLMLALSTARLAVAQGSLGDRIDIFVRDEMQRQHVPGVAIGVVKNGAVVKRYRWADG